MASDATKITIAGTEYKIGDKVWYGINYGKLDQITFYEGFVCFGAFEAEIFTCYGFYVGDINGKQISEAGLDEDFMIIN